jgi:hypothetical protein
VAEVGRQRPRIVALVGQRKATGVAQHVRMSVKAELGPADVQDGMGEIYLILARDAFCRGSVTHATRCPPGAIACHELDQLLRRPSAEPFHCSTLSAIKRVDFMAAWLSWA